MTARRINLDVPNLPDPRLIAWFEANGIDPGQVPAAQEVLIDGDQLTYVEFYRDPTGAKILDEDGGDPHYRKVLRTVTLTSAPENFGL
ncbi:hypothetical protein [Arthrobacter sp. UYCu712]|uniref:hypothetical protein n=1 Tax=Arthrobacter sp. UYCu712 TaxID=3156340 RepID=UPI0033999BD6